MSGNVKTVKVIVCNTRNCDSCNEIYLDDGVDLIRTASFIEDGPDEIWCKYCVENWHDHQSKYYDEPDVGEAVEWSDFDPDC